MSDHPNTAFYEQKDVPSEQKDALIVNIMTSRVMAMMLIGLLRRLNPAELNSLFSFVMKSEDSPTEYWEKFKGLGIVGKNGILDAQTKNSLAYLQHFDNESNTYVLDEKKVSALMSPI